MRIPSTRIPSTPQFRIKPLESDVPAALQLWRLGAVIASCVAEVPGVKGLVESGQVVPPAYEGRDTGLHHGPGQVAVVSAGTAKMAQEILRYQRDLGLTTIPAENVVGVPLMERKSLEDSMLLHPEAIRGAHAIAARSSSGRPSFYPYCGSTPAREIARRFDFEYNMDPEVAVKINDKAFLADLCEREEFKAHIPKTRRLSDLNDLGRLYQDEFVSKGITTVMVKARFGASGMNMGRASNLDELRALLSEEGMQAVFDEMVAGETINGFVLQEFIEGQEVNGGVPEKESPSVNMSMDERGVYLLGKTRQVLKGLVHVGNRSYPDLFEQCVGMEAFCSKMAKVLWEEGVLGPFGLDFLTWKDEHGVMQWKLIEINDRHIGALRGPVREHDFAMHRRRNEVEGHAACWEIGKIEMPGKGLQDFLSGLNRVNLDFDARSCHGVLATMVSAGTVHFDVHAPDAKKLKEWVGLVKSLGS